MPAHIARWWLWTCLTAVGASVALMLGYGAVLWRQDATGLALAVVALYAACTAWLGWKVRAGDSDYEFTWYMADTMERIGLLGTFIGLAVAFNSLSGLDPSSPAFKTAILHGVLTKLHCSLVGLACAIALKTQIKILEVGDEASA
ncbi:MotA/TolQ/ExbB proton channel family protein [Bosea sp. AS-1]|uniref:MotA/TolQ/ExbB proton channel family protein n=1 Tax=Bosea sp. AS-1 TaxID=2015316 RepID=UPI000B788016|nr:MotA/TolQ/ExbB proton channel family protein [Bosea sp. AS-1]